jgi:hypothetical protein
LMAASEIVVEQQCHGYKGGHQLLGGSIKLARQDQDTVDRLSDISGALRPDESFSPYLTCYPLPRADYYVIGRTWQDLEARRAGCVLTRSFLLKTQDWMELRSVADLIHQFIPINRQDLRAETFVLRVTEVQAMPPASLSRTVELTEALFLEDRQPIVVFGASDADLIITRLLTALWPGMRRGFSACSFALGPRSASGQPFDLLFSPKDLRSRFAKWEGRRIDGSGERDAIVRHKWSLGTARRIFEDPTPALSKVDILGVLASDNVGDESKLRLTLLWNDLAEQLHESPTAILGMLDVLHSQVNSSCLSNKDLSPAVLDAVQRSEGMPAPKRLAFLIPLALKLTNMRVPISLAAELKRALTFTTAADISAATRLLVSVLPDGNLMTRLLFAGIGDGLARKSRRFLEEQVFSLIDDERLIFLIAVSRVFSKEFVGAMPGNTDKAWIERLSSAFKFPPNNISREAKRSIIKNLSDGQQLPLLRTCLHGAHFSDVLDTLKAIWNNSKLTIEVFDPIILEAVRGRHELLELRNFLLALPESSATTRLIVASLGSSVDDVDWILNEQRLSVVKRGTMLQIAFSQASDALLGTLARRRKVMESVIETFNSAQSVLPPAPPYVKALAWSDVNIDLVLSSAWPLLPSLEEKLRGNLLDTFIYKGLRFAKPSSNELIGQMMSDIAFDVNPDYLVANAVAPESTSVRIGDNLVLLNQAADRLRREVLRSIDKLSLRLIQNRPENISDAGIIAWADLIRDSGQVNPIGQLRAAGSALTFALRNQKKENASALVAESFPLVYRELKQGKEPPSVWSIFFPDWDRCKVMRKELIAAFVSSSWPALDLLRAALPTGDLDRIAGGLLKDDRGTRFLRVLTEHLGDLDSAERKRVERVLDHYQRGK